MPARSKKQFRLMSAIAHSPEFAKKLNISQKVGKEFVSATKSYKKLPEQVSVSGRAKAQKRRAD
jgi:hypothetical protein